MACNCSDETVLDFMAKTTVKAKNAVIAKLLEAMAKLDDQRADEGPLNAARIQEYRQMHSKIETIIKYIQARIEPKMKSKNKD